MTLLVQCKQKGDNWKNYLTERLMVKNVASTEHIYFSVQERLKPQEERNEEERNRVDELRGTPMSVGNLEEISDDNHTDQLSNFTSHHQLTNSFHGKDMSPKRKIPYLKVN